VGDFLMYRILTVGGNNQIAEELKKIRSLSDDFEISKALCRFEALDLLKKGAFDVLIVDISTETEEGIRLIIEVKEEKICPCVIMVADNIHKEFADIALRYGVLDVLIKPIKETSASNVFKNVKSYLKTRNNIGELLDKNIYFSNYFVDLLVDDIVTKNQNTIKNAKNLMDYIIKRHDPDCVESCLVLSTMANYILERVRLKHPWIDMYLTEGDLKNHNNIYDIESSKAYFLSIVSVLYEKIRLLFLCSEEDALIKNIITMILTESDSNLSLTSISDKFYMNKTYVSEFFKKKTGILLREYIRRVKIERAKVLLGSGKYKTFEIANKLGYKDVEYFSRTFKKYTGITPSEYKNTKNI